MATDTPLPRRPETSARDLLRTYARRKKRRGEPVFCLQIGANDGVTNDPIHRFLEREDWSGLLVEPLVDVFNHSLAKAYRGNPRVTLANVALAPDSKALPFYRVAVSSARWATGLSTFRVESIRDHIANGYIARKAFEEGIRLPDDPEAIIETLTVKALTVDELLEKYHVHQVQVLCVDTEGFDLEVLKMVDFPRLMPEVVIFENKNLSDQEYRTALALLTRHSYSIFSDAGDTIATSLFYSRFHRARDVLESLARNRLGSARQRLTARRGKPQ